MQTTPDGFKALWLAPHVRACALDGQVILLDLLRSKYLAVPERPALSVEIGGWPACSTPTTGSVTDSKGAIRSLRSRQLLVDHEIPNRTERILPHPTASIEQDHHGQRLAFNAVLLTTSVLAAALSLRCRSLASIAGGIASQRRRFAGTSSSDIERLSATYARLRPLVFTSRDNCLLDSLTLMRFLAHRQLSPAWVIGVKTRPFTAHSWLQHGITVLNDRHEHVRQFRPILIV